MRKFILVLALLLISGAAIAGIFGGRTGQQSTTFTPAIIAVAVAPGTFVGGSGDGTSVGDVSVTTNGAPFTGTLAIGAGGQGPAFRLSSTTLPAKLLLNGTQVAGSYAVNLVPTQAGLTNSGNAFPQTITGTTVSAGCAQSAAFLASVSVDAAHQDAYKTYICGLVSDAVISAGASMASSGTTPYCGTKLDALWWMATLPAAANKDICGHNAYTLTPHGSPNFVTDLGYHGVDGSTTVYIDTGYNPATAFGDFTQNSAHMSVWSLTNIQSGAGDAGAAIGFYNNVASAVPNFIIDADPSKAFARGDVLEKTVDYFTDASHTNPSVIVGYGTYPSGPGGLYLYTNDGSITGTWSSRALLSSGNCYERSRSITFPGNTYPNLVASCNDQIILFSNPGNTGGNPATDTWPQQILDSTQGAHQIRIADIDGDGKQDIILSASAILGVSPNFILYQNTPTTWTRVNGPLVSGSGSLQDDVDVITVSGTTSIVGPAADGTGVYWFSYPGSRGGVWPTHQLAAAGADSMKGVATSGGTLNGKSYVVVADDEDYPNPWPPGLVYYTQPADPTQLWTQVSVDSTLRNVHEISTGSFGVGPYFIAAEEEQSCNSGGQCHVSLFQFGSGGLQRTELDPQFRGTQNQSVIPWNGGILVVGANHQVFGGYAPLQEWVVPSTLSGPVISQILPWYINGNGYGSVNANASTGQVVVAAANSSGYYAVSRTASNLETLYKSGTSIGTNTVASQSLQSLPIYLLNRNLNGSGDGGAGLYIAMASVGAGLSASDVTALQTRGCAFLTTLNGSCNPVPTISSITPSMCTFTAGTANGAVCNLSVTMEPTAPASTAALTLTGANSGGFQLVGAGCSNISSGVCTIEQSASGTSAGNYADVSVVATQTGIKNSPVMQALQLVGSPATGGIPLLGMYQGQGTSPLFHDWTGRYPDYVINLSFMGPGYGSDPSGNGGYPTIIDFSTLGNTACTSFSAAASGSCDGDYHAKLDSVVIPYASHLYAIRINSEWTQSGAFSGPFDSSCNVVIDATTWAAGVQHLVNVIRSYPALANVKIELEAPMSARDQAYWPGDSYIDLTGFDRYFFSQFDGTSTNAWDIANNQVSPCFTNINTGAAWGRAHGKPLMISEWCDTYTDGYVLSHFAAWMKDPNNNVVAQSYWDSNDAISSPNGCKLLDFPARQSAYTAAFGSSSYTGSYWTLLSGAAGNGY